MDIFSWKYPNERSRVLLWAMSLMKGWEHPAIRHLSAWRREVSVNCSQYCIPPLKNRNSKKKKTDHENIIGYLYIHVYSIQQLKLALYAQCVVFRKYSEH